MIAIIYDIQDIIYLLAYEITTAIFMPNEIEVLCKQWWTHWHFIIWFNIHLINHKP